MQIAQVNGNTSARAAQLTQKTNQLNVTTKRYTEAELSKLMAEPGCVAYTLTARDRFGDNGVVGVAIMHLANREAEVASFLLSCRVIGRSNSLSRPAGRSGGRRRMRHHGRVVPAYRKECAGFRAVCGQWLPLRRARQRQLQPLDGQPDNFRLAVPAWIVAASFEDMV